MSIYHQSSFNGGEISPKAQGRSDAKFYQSGCERLENFITEEQGGVSRRNGTELVSSAGVDGTLETSILPFQFDSSTFYAIEVGSSAIKFTDKDGNSGYPIDPTNIISEGVNGYTISGGGYTPNGGFGLADAGSATKSGILTSGTQYKAVVSITSLSTGTNPITIEGQDISIIGSGEYTVYFEASSADFAIENNSGGPSHEITNIKISGSATSVYAQDEVGEVQFSRKFDYMIMTHPNHPPHLLSRASLSPLAFEFTKLEFDYSPWLDDNTQESSTIGMHIPQFRINREFSKGQVVSTDLSPQGAPEDIMGIAVYRVTEDIPVSNTDSMSTLIGDGTLENVYNGRDTNEITSSTLRAGDVLNLTANHDYFTQEMEGLKLKLTAPSSNNGILDRGVANAGDTITVPTFGKLSSVELYGEGTCRIRYGNGWLSEAPDLTDADMNTIDTFLNDKVGSRPVIVGNTGSSAGHPRDYLDWVQITNVTGSLDYTVRYEKTSWDGSVGMISPSSAFYDFSGDSAIVSDIGFATSNVFNVSHNNWEVTTSGDQWNGFIDIERSTDSGKTFQSYATFDTTGVSKSNKIITSPTREVDNTFIRVRFTDDNSDPSNITHPKVQFSLVESEIIGIVKLEEFIDSRTFKVSIDSAFDGIMNTYKYALEAFNHEAGYPAASKFFQNRLWFSGTKFEPSALYASVSGDYFNFLGGLEDDLAIKRIIDSPERSLFIEGKKRLFLGTEGGVTSVGSASDEALATPSNIETIPENSFGTKLVQPVFASGAVIHADKSGKKLREIIYSAEEQGYGSNDLTILCNELFEESPIVKLAIGTVPTIRVYAVQENGNAAVLVYNRSQGIGSWSRITTDGNYKSVAVFSEDGNDSAWWIVERGGSYSLEKELSDTFLDSSVEVASGTATVTTPSNMVGKDVYVLRDGKYVGYAPSAGATILLSGITYIDGESYTAGVHTIGLNYESLVRPLPIEPVIQGALPNSRVKGVSKMYVKFYNTKQVSVGEKDKTATIDEDLDTTSASGNIAELEVKEKRFYLAQDFNNQKILEIKQTLPYPMTVLSLSAWVEVYGG